MLDVLLITCALQPVGTAAPIGPDTFVTAHHVLAGRDDCSVGGRPYKVVSVDPERDLMVGRVRVTLDPLPISCEPIRASARYRLRDGQGRIRRWTQPTGRAARTADPVARVQYAPMVEMEGTVPHGASGGPVLDEEGRVVAIISSATHRFTYVSEIRNSSLCPTR